VIRSYCKRELTLPLHSFFQKNGDVSSALMTRYHALKQFYSLPYEFGKKWLSGFHTLSLHPFRSRIRDKLELPVTPSLTCHVRRRFITLLCSFYPCSHLSLQRPVFDTAPSNYGKELMISISEVSTLVRLHFVLSNSRAFPAHRWIPKNLAKTRFSGTALRIFSHFRIRGNQPSSFRCAFGLGTDILIN
jgi:hypothetical protein